MKRLFLVSALMAALGGCVTETSYIGKDGVREGVDRQTAAKTRLSLGLRYLNKGDMTQAKVNLERAAEFDPDNPDIPLARAYYFQKVGDMKSAEASYQTLLSKNPNSADGHNNYGAFLCAQKRYADADSHFQKALAQPNYVRMDDTYENMALCAVQSGHLQKAAQYYDLALGYSPMRGNLLLSAAELALKQNDSAKATGYMQRYNQSSKPNAQSLWLNVELAQQRGELAQLHKYGRELVQQFPKSDQAKRYLNNDY